MPWSDRLVSIERGNGAHSVFPFFLGFDAPFDEFNIGRFVKVLDRFIDRSQFIVVTHSKRTMARADGVDGVTMEEFGVSKPVGMRLTAADESKAGKEIKSAAQKAALRLDS